MSIKRIFAVASIFALSAIVLVIYPSTDKSMYAGQSKSTQSVTTLTNAHQITVSSNDVIVHYFGKNAVDKIMKQPGCASVRMYYGKHANGISGFVIVGVDKNDKDLPILIAMPTNPCIPKCEG